jgi:hypothetical protein
MMTQRRRARMLAVFVMAMGLAILAREGSGGPTPTFNPRFRYEPLSGDPDGPDDVFRMTGIRKYVIVFVPGAPVMRPILVPDLTSRVRYQSVRSRGNAQ